MRSALTFLFAIWSLHLPEILGESLRDKSNAELLETMLGSERIQEHGRQEAKMNAPQVPPGFWGMGPEDAALELVKSKRPESLRTKLQITIPNARNLQPPNGGEVGLRWRSSGEAIEPREGLAI